MNRRDLLKSLAVFGVSASVFSPRAFGQAGQGKTLVVVFLRGGVDGLSMVPPVGDAAYAGLRPSLKLKALGMAGDDDVALPLEGPFALHPALAPLLPLYRAGNLAVVHAVGQTKPSRSHFDAQDFLESGTPGQRANDGWLNRGAPVGGDSAFRLVALQNTLPLALSGDAPALALPALKDFKVGGPAAAASTFDSLYASAVDEALRGSAHEAFAGTALVSEGKLGQRPAENGAAYPKSPLGDRLQDIARLIHADTGLRIAATETGGFDTHLAQGAGKGQLSARLADLGQALAAFATDLGPRLSDVCVVTMTEFGRTARENGTRGTDHGTASAQLVLGGGVKGGHVFADWPGLGASALFENRDLRVTTDVRTVLAHCLERCGGDVRRAFPDFTAPALPLFG